MKIQALGFDGQILRVSFKSAASGDQINATTKSLHKRSANNLLQEELLEEVNLAQEPDEVCAGL